VKFTRGEYFGSPCWTFKARWAYMDADWNTRFPYGTSLMMRVGTENAGVSFTLDWNAPIGEPNRLYLNGGSWHVVLGLPSVRDFEETGREVVTDRTGRQVTQVHGRHFRNWLHPHLDGCSRYRYHKDDRDNWVRNDRPERLHWGWLTISKKETE
jgi:hypothetical protein